MLKDSGIEYRRLEIDLTGKTLAQRDLERRLRCEIPAADVRFIEPDPKDRKVLVLKLAAPAAPWYTNSSEKCAVKCADNVSRLS